jgi:molybdopterin converting factor small subunit
MDIKVKIFYSELQRRTGNQDSVMVSGNTVGDCLHDLVRRYPDTRKLIFNEQGKLLERVFVFVNAEGMQKADLNRTLTETDVLILTLLVMGG